MSAMCVSAVDQTNSASSTAWSWTKPLPTKLPPRTSTDRNWNCCCHSSGRAIPCSVTPWIVSAATLTIFEDLSGADGQRGVHVQFVKKSLTFTGEDSPMASLLLSVMGAFAQFERELIREPQREGIALAKGRGAYVGRKRSLTSAQAANLLRRVHVGESKTILARELGVTRDTIY